MSLSKPIYSKIIPAVPDYSVVVLDVDKFGQATGGVSRLPVIAWQIEISNCIGPPGERCVSVVPITHHGIIDHADYALEYVGRPPLFGEHERFDSVAELLERFASSSGGRR